ncbi:hypothetical protein [Streptomyces sp. NPDC005955]|uniref:hypothetical protein n=1 Tax=Streptomyces sp. NPDC005955 TaxID=3364738 RepID=UPI0036BEC526
MNQTFTDPQLLTQALKLGVHADQQAIHGARIEDTVPVHGQPGDDPHRALVPTVAEPLDHLGAPDRNAVTAVWIHCCDQVGNLKPLHEREL